MSASSKSLMIVVLASLLALSGCGGGGSGTVPLGANSNSSTSPALAASAMETQANALFARARSLNTDDPEDDNVWELVAEAWTLVAQAARIRAVAATAADNTEAAEAWTLAAEAASGYAQAARALATGTQDTGPDITIGSELATAFTTIERNGIVRAFGATKLDHYTFDAQNIPILAPPVAPELFPPCGPSDSADVCQVRTDANAAKLEIYHAELAAYEAGQNWVMVAAASEIASRGQVFAMLRENAWRSGEFDFDEQAGEWIPDGAIMGHLAPPVVRFLDTHGSEIRTVTLRAIDNINAWLPWEKHITVGDDYNAAEIKARMVGVSNAYGDPSELFDEKRLDNLVAAQTALDEVLRKNDILVNFLKGIGDPGCSDVAGCATNFGIEVNFSHINLIQHELLHNMGLSGGRTCYETFGVSCNPNSASDPQVYYSHVPVALFPESTMAYASPYNASHGLSQIDGETLQIIYTRESLWGERFFLNTYFSFPGQIPLRERGLLEPNRFHIWPDDLSIESMGPWDDFVVRYQGSFDQNLSPWEGVECQGDCPYVEPAFGVDWRNGMARPWADGEVTPNTLAESGLSGTATWNGGLVGFTPAKEAVHGDSAISVDLAAMTGNAAFTELEHWAAGAVPGGTGTGMQWGDGALHYALAINGNYLRSYGGDDGYVSGRFVGAKHEGVVGILERPDLTGAFGARRGE